MAGKKNAWEKGCGPYGEVNKRKKGKKNKWLQGSDKARVTSNGDSTINFFFYCYMNLHIICSGTKLKFLFISLL